MLGPMSGPDGDSTEDFNDYDFGDEQPSVVPDPSSAQADATETENDNNFMDEGALFIFHMMVLHLS